MTEVFWFSEQPYGHVKEDDLAPYESGRMHFPNTHFDPIKAHTLYNNYHDQYAWADEMGFDGIMSNEHHSAYWCMKPSVNVDAAVIAKVTKKVKIAMLGNVIALNDPVKMAEEIAMLDCISGGRIISGFVRGTAVETLHAGISPTENRERFEEAHDLILKCWTEPLPFGLMAMLRTSLALNHDFCLLQDIKFFTIERPVTHVHIEALQDG